MKTKLLLLLGLLLIAISAIAVEKKPEAQDTTVRKDTTVKIDELSVLASELNGLKSTANEIRDSLAAYSMFIKNSACTPVQGKDLTGFWNWVLVFLPAIIFLIVTLSLLFALKDFDYREALKENEVTKVVVPNPYYTGQLANVGQSDYPLTMEVTPNVTTTPGAVTAPGVPPLPAAAQANPHSYTLPGEMYRPSISRYIALISSVLIIIMAVCLACFFNYHYIKTTCPPELTSLSNVSATLSTKPAFKSEGINPS